MNTASSNNLCLVSAQPLAEGCLFPTDLSPAHIDDDTTFVNAIDHGSFPNLEGTNTAPLYDLVKLGPELSVSLQKIGRFPLRVNRKANL